MADNQQAIGYITQTALGSAGTVTAPIYGITGFANPSRIGSESPHYKTNQAFNQTSVLVKTREGEVTVEGKLSPGAILPLLESALGPAAAGVCKAGVGTRKFLTVKFAEGLTQYWQSIDMACNTLEITYTVQDGFAFRAQLLGPAPTVTASAWSTIAAVPTARVPFSSWEAWINKGGTAACVRRFRIAVDNKMEPLYCSPSTEPDGTAIAGLSPTRYVYGDGEITIEFEALYTANAGSNYEEFQGQTVAADWQLKALDPGGTAVVQFDIARLGFTDGEIMRERVNYEHMTGFALLDDTAGANLTATVVS